jgi:hypothetical protein
VVRRGHRAGGHRAGSFASRQRQFSAPTVKQHLAGLRILFDWLVTGHIIETNPAHAVRGPRYVVTKGKTPVLAVDEARAVLDAIAATRKSAGREPNAPSLGERVLALATGKTGQELYLECPNDRPNHIGIAVQRHLRAGRIQERDGKLYATSPTAQEIA